jgi:hypothetical protein
LLLKNNKDEESDPFLPYLGSNTYWQQFAALWFPAQLRVEGYPELTIKKSAAV